MHAFRNLRNCTKDCLCLYVCPTGASDTENGQIDFKKCIACGLCVSACPSHAISMVPDTFAPVSYTHLFSFVIKPSDTKSQAIFKAALAVRLPLRVCSIYSLPFSIVNSISCISR